MDGEPWFNKRPQEIEIEKFIIHRSWKGTHQNLRGHLRSQGRVQAESHSRIWGTCPGPQVEY